MPNYLLVYHGGTQPQSQEEGAKVMREWVSWMDSLGDAMVDGGNPVGTSKTISPDGSVKEGGQNLASGYSILRASSVDDAVSKSKGCPHLKYDGSIEVAEIIEMG
jgi:hypothetical protein